MYRVSGEMTSTMVKAVSPMHLASSTKGCGIMESQHVSS